MKHFSLQQEDIIEIKDIAEYILKKHGWVTAENKKFTNDFINTDDSSLVRVGHLFGYRGNTIYNIFNKKSAIPEPRLKDFLRNIDRIIKRDGSSRVLGEKYERAQRLVNKIKTQPEEKEKSGDLKPVRSIMELFQGKDWYLYERVYAGIERHIISFTKGFDSNTLLVTVKTTDEINSPWSGTGHFDDSKSFLVIQTTKSRVQNSSPANYLIRVDNEAANIDLCIGHVTLAKRSTKNIISKTIILQKIVGNHTGTRLITREDIAQDTSLIDPSIVRFFADKMSNRLTSPHSSIILSLKTLKEWHAENDKVKREQRNNAVIGTYSIFYRGEMLETPLTEDKLVIKENESCDLVAEYSHALNKNNIQTWKGLVTYSPTTKGVFINLRGPYGKSVPENTNSIFVILNLPPGEIDFEIVTGIASGVQDNYNSSIALMILAVRHSEKTKAVTKEDESIKQFFEVFAHRAIILPPHHTVSSFDDLKNTLQEGMESKQALNNYPNGHS